MGVLAILLLSFGAFCLAKGENSPKCVPEIVKCSKIWRVTHKSYVDIKYSIDHWCRYQDQFYKCLEKVFLEKSSILPSSFVISELFSRDLCEQDSIVRKRIIIGAEMINTFYVDMYPLPDYLKLIPEDDDTRSTRCLKAENVLRCMASPRLRWSFDAARVYRTTRRIIKDGEELCAILRDQVHVSLGATPASKPKRTFEIYSRTVNPIGNILDEGDDQDELSDSASEKSTEDVENDAFRNAIENL